MRRRDKEVTDRRLIDSIIRRSQVCRIALCEGETPYIVPMCFGYDGASLFLHSAAEGRKIDILRKNPRICFEFDADCEVVAGEKPCSFSMRSRSVIGSGRAVFLEAPEERQEALKLITGQYTSRAFEHIDDAGKNFLVIRVDIEEISGKQSGYTA
jgi:hypothetical protein